MCALIANKTAIGLVPPEVLETGERIIKALLEGGTAGWTTLTGKNISTAPAGVDYGKPAEVLKSANAGESAVTDVEWGGDRSGRVALILPAAGAKEVVAYMTALMLGGNPDPQNTLLDAEGMDAYSEAVGSFFGQAAQQVRAELGGVVKLTVGKTRLVDLAGESPDGTLGTDDLICRHSRITIEGRPPFQAEILMSPSITGIEISRDGETGETIEVEAENRGIDPGNLRNAMKLKLPLIVVIASKKLRMELIQEMSPGTIIEFRKMSGEMLDVMAGNIKVGEAEVVITNQCFGVQMRTIVDPKAVQKT